MTATLESGPEIEAGSETANFRYPGSPPFRDDELHRRLFQGRADEAQAVLNSILSSDLFLLYSVSGLGKSSLLNAGVLQSLRTRDHWPVILRLNDPGSDPIGGLARQIQEAAQGSGVELLNAPGAGEVTEATSLWDMLVSLEVWKDNELQKPVVVFDQFEELFTLGWKPEVRQRFIEDLGEVVRGHRRPERGQGAIPGVAPNVKFVLVIREDALGELEALASEIPQVMRNRFRLDPLSDEQATAAVTAPGVIDDPRLTSPKFTFTDAALDTLLGFLGKSSEDGEGTAIGNTRPGIDPSQLQIICQFIERATVRFKAEGSPPGTVVEIDEADLGGTEGLERILGTFYRRSVEQFPPAQRPAIRTLCETGLINADGRRLSLEEGDIQARYGVDHDTLQRLVHERLMRAEPRVGSIYYEIAHDTLVVPILEDRDNRLAVRRRRRMEVVGTILGFLVVLLVAGAFLWLGSNSGEEATPLSIGEVVAGSVEVGGEWVVYSIDADTEEALVISVEPGEELNPAVEVSAPDGVTRIQDESGNGEAEYIVIPPVTKGDPHRRVRVSSFDSTTGGFDLDARTTQVTVLEEEVTLSGELTADDPVAVFAVDSSGGDKNVSVIPVVEPGGPSASADGPASGGEPADGSEEASDGSKLLDVRVEAIDFSGKGLSVNNSAAGREETASITGEGTGYLVVSSVDSLEGTFRIREHPASEVGSAQTVANLTPEVPQAGEVRADVTQVWTIAGSEDLPTGVVVRPIGTLDPVLVVKLPDEQEVRIDQLPVGAIEYVLLPPGLGTFEVVVEGYDGTEGAFEIESELVEPELLTPSDLDEPVAYAEGPTTYVVETSDPAALLALTAQPGPSSAVVAQLVIDETVRSAAGYGGEPAQLILSGAASDIHLVTVIPSDSWSVAVKLQPIEPLPIEVGAPVTAEGTNAFTTEVPPDSVLNFTVEPLGAPFLSVDLISPSGDMIPAAESEEEGSPVTVNIGSSQGGTYQVVVTPMPGQGDYEARLEPG